MRVNEIFYSLQGEGHFTGTPALFIRLAGCNMHCDFCDTSHESFTEMSVGEIVDEAAACAATHVVLTGGEPTLQITRELLDALHGAGKYIQIETNGTCPVDEDAVDWITCSPKSAAIPVINRIDELKVVYRNQPMEAYEAIRAGEYRLQPCDTGDAAVNKVLIESAIEYVKSHPMWRLSLQTHKMLDIR